MKLRETSTTLPFFVSRSSSTPVVTPSITSGPGRIVTVSVSWPWVSLRIRPGCMVMYEFVPLGPRSAVLTSKRSRQALADWPAPVMGPPDTIAITTAAAHRVVVISVSFDRSISRPQHRWAAVYSGRWADSRRRKISGTRPDEIVLVPVDGDADVTEGPVEPRIRRRVREGVLAANLIGDAQRCGPNTVERRGVIRDASGVLRQPVQIPPPRLF